MYFFLLMTIVAYTRMSLNKKKYLGLGFLRHSFIRTPSPTRARPGIAKGFFKKIFMRENYCLDSNLIIASKSFFDAFYSFNVYFSIG